MTQEPVTLEAPTEATQQPFGETVETPVVDATSPEDAEPSEATDEAPDSEAWLATLEADDNPHKDRYKAHLDKIREEGWQAAQDYYGPQFQQTQQIATERKEAYDRTTQAFSDITGRLRKLVDDGMLSEDSLSNVLRSNQHAWAGLQSIGEEAQQEARKQGFTAGANAQGYETASWLMGELAKSAGKPSLMAKFASRIEAAKKGMDAPEKIVADFAEELKSAVYSQGLTAGRKGGKEDAMVNVRKDIKPTQAGGTPATNSPTSMAEADRRYNLPDNHPERMTHAEYKAARKTFGIDKE